MLALQRGRTKKRTQRPKLSILDNQMHYTLGLLWEQAASLFQKVLVGTAFVETTCYRLSLEGSLLTCFSGKFTIESSAYHMK